MTDESGQAGTCRYSRRGDLGEDLDKPVVVFLFGLNLLYRLGYHSALVQ